MNSGEKQRKITLFQVNNGPDKTELSKTKQGENKFTAIHNEYKAHIASKNGVISDFEEKIGGESFSHQR